MRARSSEAVGRKAGGLSMKGKCVGKKSTISREEFEKLCTWDSVENKTTGTRCKLWTPAKPGKYGVVCGERAHRVSWKLFVGNIPDGMCVLHRCDNPRCVRPEHLFIGTAKENIDDMYSKGRAKSPSGEIRERLPLSTVQQLAVCRMAPCCMPKLHRWLKGFDGNRRTDAKIQRALEQLGISVKRTVKEPVPELPMWHPV